MGDTRATMTLFGRFSVVAADQTELTPPSKKACGLLALLALSPNRTRSRRWLQEKLWSDRGQEQGNASLRQCLSEIRKAFGDQKALIKSKGQDVQLPEPLWNFCLESPQADGPDAPQFLEGIDIRDPEFAAWLHHVRSNRGGGASVPINNKGRAAAPLTVFYRHDTNSHTGTNMVGESLASQVGLDIAGRVNGRLFALRARGPEQRNTVYDIDVRCKIIEEQDRAALSINVFQSNTGSVLYTHSQKIEEPPLAMLGHDDLAQITYEAAERTVLMLTRTGEEGSDRITALRMAHIAIDKIFASTKQGFLEADQLLAAAWKLDQNPNFPAWRAYIRNSQCMERVALDEAKAKREAAEFITLAMEHGPENPFVLSLCSLVKIMLFGEVDGGLTMARSAIAVNPNNAFALQSISMAQMAADDVETAYETSLRSQRIAGQSSHGHWWNTCHALTCLATGRFEEAVTLAEMAMRRMPAFRPPLRALLALYGADERSHDFSVILARLKAAEPDFSVERFLTDPNYPVRTLRKSGLLDKISPKKLDVDEDA
ncbi:MAG: hypothetical protein AAGK38_05515 [Pseudomonadota bacterium]